MNILSTFTVEYVLPDEDPQDPNGQYLYYFIGVENIGEGNTILQPVVAWENARWIISSWVKNFPPFYIILFFSRIVVLRAKPTKDLSFLIFKQVMWLLVEFSLTKIQAP